MDCSFGAKLPGLIPGSVPDLRALVERAVQLEAIGFDDVVDSEHVLFAPEMRHPGGSGAIVHGRDQQHSDRGDPLVLFGAIAARTEKLRMATGVVLAAAHGFAVLARQAATLDQLSGGRFSLGVGAGWFAGEFAALGIPPEERGWRLEEVIRACQELWRPGLSSFDGRSIHFTDVIAEPAPFTPAGVPVWWGGDGRSGPTARRVAELGRGWIAREAADDAEVAVSIARIADVCEASGRDPGTVGFRASLTTTGDVTKGDGLIERAVVSGVRRAEAGVTHFTIPLNDYGLDDDGLADLLAALRAATRATAPGRPATGEASR